MALGDIAAAGSGGPVTTSASAAPIVNPEHLRTALLDSASHDLRSSLAGILGSATTLLTYRKTLSDVVCDDLLANIRDEAERMSGYLAGLITMTKLEGGALRARDDPTDVADVLRGAMRRVAERGRRHRFLCDAPTAACLAATDASLLEQAIVNVLENAVDYSPAESAITIALARTRREFVITVEDQGPGIPPPVRGQMMERFARGRDHTAGEPGSGLGLSIARTFIMALGGRIEIDDPALGGVGARVSLAVPRRRDGAGEHRRI